MPLITTNDTAFEVDVLKSSKPVVVDFWAEWCGPCKMIAPFLEELAVDKYETVVVAKVNIDDNPLTPTRYGVRGIPNFVVLRDDKNYAPPYNMTPVVRKEILDKNPKIAEALNTLAAKLNNETMGKLNASVDVDKKTPEEVADPFLKANGLV